MKELTVDIEPLVVVDGPLDRFKGPHHNPPGQKTVFLVVTFELPGLIGEEFVNLLLAQVLNPLLDPLAPHLARNAVVQVLDQGLLRPVQAVAQVVVIVEGVVDLLDLLLADENLAVEHDVAETHVSVAQVLGIATRQLEVVETRDEALNLLSCGRLVGRKALGQRLHVEPRYPPVHKLEVGHLNHVVLP